MLKPYKFQIADSERAVQQNLLIANETGTGKTLITIEAIISMMTEGMNPQNKPVLIIVPKSIKEQWENAIYEQFDRGSYYMPASNIRKPLYEVDESSLLQSMYSDDISSKPFESLNYFPKREILTFPVAIDFIPKKGGICITHPDNVRVNYEYYSAVNWLIIVFDEAHRISNAANIISKRLKKMKADRCIALTGTPFDRNPAKIWSILNWLSPTNYNSYATFEARHTLWRNNKVVGCQNHKRFAEAIAPFTVRRNKRDIWADLPEKIISIIKLPLLPQQEKAYLTCLSALNNTIQFDPNDENAVFTVFGQLALITRCQQATSLPSGIIQQGNVPFRYCNESSKVDWVVDFCENMVLENDGDDVKSVMDEVNQTLGIQQVNEVYATHEQKVFIVCSFSHTAKFLAEKLRNKNIAVSLLIGGMKESEWNNEVRKLKSNSDWDRTNIGITIIEAGGQGLDLPMVDNLVFLDIEYSSIKMTQAIDRIRDSFTNPKNVYYLLNEGTIDEVVYEAFGKKMSEQKFIFSALEFAQKPYEPKLKRGRPKGS